MERDFSRPEVEPSICAAKNGSPSALGSLLESCRDYLLLIANEGLDSELRTKLGPSDLVQQTFLHAQRGFAEFRGTTQADLHAWLRAILLHEMSRTRRRFQLTQKRNPELEVPLEGNGAIDNPASVLVYDTPLPVDRLLTDEKWTLLARAVEQLPEDYRRVVRLRYWERKTLGEIAAELGRTSEAVRKLWVRAVEQLERKCAELE